MVKPCAWQTVPSLDPKLVTHAGRCRVKSSAQIHVCLQEPHLKPYDTTILVLTHSKAVETRETDIRSSIQSPFQCLPVKLEGIIQKNSCHFSVPYPKLLFKCAPRLSGVMGELRDEYSFRYRH